MLKCRICNKPMQGSPQKRYCSIECVKKSPAYKKIPKRGRVRAKPESECAYCRNLFVLTTPNKITCSKNCQRNLSKAKSYGLTVGEHQILTRDFQCNICGTKETHQMCIDHCHTTDKVRGYLCSKCNTGLGHFNDSIKSLRNAINYLSTDSIKKQIVTLMKDAYRRGWVTSRDGNISYLDNNNSIMYITPSGVRKQELTVDDILEVHIISGIPDIKNINVSIEFEMHWLIQRYQGGGAVIHFHPTQVVAAMLAQIKLKDIHAYFPELNRFTQVGECVDIIFPGETKLAKETLKNIQGFDIVGLKSHGVTSRGSSLNDAFEHIERLNHCCEMALSAGAFKEIL